MRDAARLETFPPNHAVGSGRRARGRCVVYSETPEADGERPSRLRAEGMVFCWATWGHQQSLVLSWAQDPPAAAWV